MRAYWAGFRRGYVKAHLGAALVALVLLPAPGCSRPVPSTPAEAAPVFAPHSDADDCPGGMCDLPGAMK